MRAPLGDEQRLLFGYEHVKHAVLLQPGVLLRYGSCGRRGARGQVRFAGGARSRGPPRREGAAGAASGGRCSARSARVSMPLSHLTPLATDDLTWLFPETSNFLNMAAVQIQEAICDLWFSQLLFNV